MCTLGVSATTVRRAEEFLNREQAVRRGRNRRFALAFGIVGFLVVVAGVSFRSWSAAHERSAQEAAAQAEHQARSTEQQIYTALNSRDAGASTKLWRT